MFTDDLFADHSLKVVEEIEEDVYLLKFMLNNDTTQILAEIEKITQHAPPRQMQTPGGYNMSAYQTNCGEWGWVTDSKGYRYAQVDPLTQQSWPPMPLFFSKLAMEAAARAGFVNFKPDACLINEYHPGAKMGLHQDKDEQSFDEPIVSFSLGLPVKFQFGGLNRTDPKQSFWLEHGDVLVWGRSKRLHYHGVLTLKKGEHPLLGAKRINLTFRRAH